jgi:hypothetical protein
MHPAVDPDEDPEEEEVDVVGDLYESLWDRDESTEGD